MCNLENCNRKIYFNEMCIKHFTLNKIQKKENGDANPYKKKWHKLYYTNSWKSLRLKKLSKNPLCEFCNQEGKDIDHIIDHKGDRNLFYDMRNLQTLCKECHGRKSNEDLRISNFPKSQIEVKFIISEKCMLDESAKHSGVEPENEYNIDLVLNTNKLKFNFLNSKRARLAERRFIIRNKLIPHFVYEYKDGNKEENTS